MYYLIFVINVINVRHGNMVLLIFQQEQYGVVEMEKLYILCNLPSLILLFSEQDWTLEKGTFCSSLMAQTVQAHPELLIFGTSSSASSSNSMCTQTKSVLVLSSMQMGLNQNSLSIHTTTSKLFSQLSKDFV